MRNPNQYCNSFLRKTMKIITTTTTTTTRL